MGPKITLDDVEESTVNSDGAAPSALAEGTSTTLAKGLEETRFITYDSSYHDHSRHHYGDNHVSITNYHGVPLNLSKARDRLLEHVSYGSLHNSAQRGPDAPKCFPETRVAVQEEIRSWINHGHQDTNPKKILWLSGPAGSGKTAIAGSIADACFDDRTLAAAFFFSSFGGSPDRCSKVPFIATLVYQLIQHNDMCELRDEVLAALDRDPLILKRNLDAQADTLLLNPLRKVSSRSSAQAWPHLVLVDGLDECTGETGKNEAAQDTHREILSILIRASNDPSFPFRIIIASRPEQAIKRFFLSLPKHSLKEVFLNDKYDATADIELYLRAMLVKIGRDYNLQEDWYTHLGGIRDVLLHLAREASGQFIYAATVIRYVQDGTSTPAEQLRRVMSSWRPAGSNPFSALDALYTMILQASPTPLMSATWIVSIGSLSGLHYSAEAWYIKALFESSPGETEVRLGNLASIVGVPSGEEKPFTFYHKSLFDFLEQPERSGELYVEIRRRESFLADRYYQVLKNRGPQIPMRTDQFLNRFIFSFCNVYSSYYSPAFLYDASDVNWWCSHADFEHHSGWHVQYAFFKAHRKCRWHHCNPCCKAWRKGIMQHCKAKGWHVPTWTELLQDRFKKVDFLDQDRGARDDYPLRPPSRR